MMIVLSPQLQERAPLLIAACLGAAVFISTGINFKSWYSDWALTHQAAFNQPIETRDETVAMINAIPEEHLFGHIIADDGNMPISSLGLRVTGIVKADKEDPESISKVYISIAGKPSKIYLLGDSLPYGVKVYDITADTVILENDGHLEKLPLPRDRAQFKAREEITEEV